MVMVLTKFRDLIAGWSAERRARVDTHVQGVLDGSRTCKHCRYFIDYSDSEPDPDEVNGYCAWALVHDKSNEYGGTWTHTDSTCMEWDGRPNAHSGHDAALGNKPDRG